MLIAWSSYDFVAMFSYIIFFICIKGRLLYIFIKRTVKSNLTDLAGTPDIPISSGSSAGESVSAIRSSEMSSLETEHRVLLMHIS